MTSLLRDDVAVPKLASHSKTTTERPERLKARATARPTTPAPITMASTSGVMSGEFGCARIPSDDAREEII